MILRRRQFISRALASAAAVSLPEFAFSQATPFKLNYAPHAGLFENSAGPSIVDQIDFAADAGFTAWEDNDMRGRSVSGQESIAEALRRRSMQMGVFVGADVSCEELRSSLSAHRGNVAAVGRQFGKERMQVHRWMKRYGINVDEYRE